MYTNLSVQMTCVYNPFMKFSAQPPWLSLNLRPDNYSPGGSVIQVAEPAVFNILKSLVYFSTCIHNEGTVSHNGFPYRLAA